jgi:hypothetical protein
MDEEPSCKRQRTGEELGLGAASLREGGQAPGSSAAEPPTATAPAADAVHLRPRGNLSQEEAGPGPGSEQAAREHGWQQPDGNVRSPGSSPRLCTRGCEGHAAFDSFGAVSDTDAPPEYPPPPELPPWLAVGAYSQREEALIKREQEGEIQFRYVLNNDDPQNLIHLVGLKNIYGKQLPNMPKVRRGDTPLLSATLAVRLPSPALLHPLCEAPLVTTLPIRALRAMLGCRPHGKLVKSAPLPLPLLWHRNTSSGSCLIAGIARWLWSSEGGSSLVASRTGAHSA